MKIKKLFAVILLFALLAGCSLAGDDNKITNEMNQTEKLYAESFKPFYQTLKSETVSDCVFDTNETLSGIIADSFATLLPNAAFEDITVKQIGSIDEKEFCAVICKYNTANGTVLINDSVLIDKIGEKPYIVLQQFYNNEIQSNIADSFDAYYKTFNRAFEVCNKAFGNGETVSSMLCLSDETRSICDESGNSLTSGIGVINDFSYSIEHILQLSQINSNSEGRGGADFLEDVKKENASQEKVPQTLDDGRKLVWNIEFNEDHLGLLSGKLNTKHDSMAPSGILHVAEGGENLFIEDGNLVLRVTQNQGGTYTTARTVSTKDKMAYKYGYLEMRAMVPYQNIAWPGFWMQSDTKLQKSKYFGEIDIFEVFGSNNTAVFNLHKWYGGNSVQSQDKGNFTGSRYYKFSNFTNLSKQYHTYGFEWTKDYMKAYIDGRCYYTIYIREEDDYAPERPGMDLFHDYYYVIWNNWLMENKITASNKPNTPIDYKIDYVRLYQHTDREYIKIY